MENKEDFINTLNFLAVPLFGYVVGSLLAVIVFLLLFIALNYKD